MTSETPYAEVIGDPVEHSLSPAIHRFWLRKVGLQGDYRATCITAGDLGAYFETRRSDPFWRGCNITMPLKLRALSFVEKSQDPTFPIEPANLAIPQNGRLIGHNTDIHGVMEPLEALHLGTSQGTTTGNVALILGAGGALYPVVWSLLSLGYAKIILVARDRAKVEAYLGRRGGLEIAFLRWGEPLPPCDILVNATPLGMRGYPDLPYDASSVRTGGIVFDLVYQPLETTILRDARDRELQTVDGLQMLVGQAAPSFARFFGRSAPREHDAELRELLTA